jgi:hypothetical protein
MSRIGDWMVDSPVGPLVFILGLVALILGSAFTLGDRIGLRSAKADRAALASALAVRESLGEDVIGQVVEFNRQIARGCEWASIPVLISDRWCDLHPLPIPQ